MTWGEVGFIAVCERPRRFVGHVDCVTAQNRTAPRRRVPTPGGGGRAGAERRAGDGIPCRRRQRMAHRSSSSAPLLEGPTRTVVRGTAVSSSLCRRKGPFKYPGAAHPPARSVATNWFAESAEERKRFGGLGEVMPEPRRGSEGETAVRRTSSGSWMAAPRARFVRPLRPRRGTASTRARGSLELLLRRSGSRRGPPVALGLRARRECPWTESLGSQLSCDAARVDGDRSKDAGEMPGARYGRAPRRPRKRRRSRNVRVPRSPITDGRKKASASPWSIIADANGSHDARERKRLPRLRAGRDDIGMPGRPAHASRPRPLDDPTRRPIGASRPASNMSSGRGEHLLESQLFLPHA